MLMYSSVREMKTDGKAWSQHAKNLLQKKENNLFSTPMDREKGNAGMKSELCFMFSGRKSFFPRKGTTVPKKATRESVKSLL